MKLRLRVHGLRLGGKTGARAKLFFFLLVIGCLQLAGLCGCGPTYPKEKFKESIIKICKTEYKVDVKVHTVGKTIAIYLPLQDLMDFTFSITKAASEKINDVILSVSRVALSSDAKYDFYCVIAHDTRIPEIQIVIIKSVDDVKRFLLNDISRGEYSKRMLIDIRLSPQAQKERNIKEVFEKMGLDPRWQEQVMNDFFRSEPAALGDIGYWNGHFYIKDILHSEFLAEQMASRIKMESREDERFSKSLSVRSTKGSYLSGLPKRYFKLEMIIEPGWLKEPGREEVSNIAFQLAGEVAYKVTHGYRFDDFDYVEMIDQSGGRTVEVTKEELKKFKPKKAKIDDIMEPMAY